MIRIMPFWTTEEGAVSVDWIVLTASMVALAVAAATTADKGIQNVGDQIVETLEDEDV